MNSFTQLVQNVKDTNWQSAGQVFKEIMQQKMADRVAVERQTIFKEDGSEAYKKHFDSMLKKYSVSSPADIPDDKKDDFFNAVDAGYKAKDEATTPLKEDKKPYVWECMDCENIWRSTQSGNTQNVRCPKCHSDDVLPGKFTSGRA